MDAYVHKFVKAIAKDLIRILAAVAVVITVIAAIK